MKMRLFIFHPMISLYCIKCYTNVRVSNVQNTMKNVKSLNRLIVIREETKIGLQTQAIIRWRLMILDFIQKSVAPLRGFTGQIRTFTHTRMHTQERHTVGVDGEITKKLQALKKECNEIQNKQRSATGFIPLIMFLVLVAICNVLNCFQVLITNLSAWVERSQPIVPECGHTIEDAKEINSTYCNTFVERMGDPITYFLTIQTNLAEMYRPRFECTQTISVCNVSDCNLWNAEEFQIMPDPFRRDKPVCVNEIEIAFLVVTGILALSGLLLAYRWKSTVEVLGIEAEVKNLRRLSRSFSTFRTQFPSMFLARGWKAPQNSSVFTIGPNEESEEAPSDIPVKAGKPCVGPQAKVSEGNSSDYQELSDDDSSLMTIQTNKGNDQQSRNVPDECGLMISETINDSESSGKVTAESSVLFSPNDRESKYKYIVAPQRNSAEDTPPDSCILTIGQNQLEEQLGKDIPDKNENKITLLEAVNAKDTSEEVRSFVCLPHSRNIS